tara:strand:- start:72 stop:317 length:246 start_codon:yes stop_codon:yes gene_type:complete
MPGNWTPEKKEAQSKKLKEYWKRRREQEKQAVLQAEQLEKIEAWNCLKEDKEDKLKADKERQKKASGFLNTVIGLMKRTNA